jgi:hypothetical protein
VSENKSVELRVSVDVGYRRHSVAIGLPNGEVLEEFEIAHRPEGFKEFFSRASRSTKTSEAARLRSRWKATTGMRGRWIAWCEREATGFTTSTI